MSDFLNIIARKEADAMTVWSGNVRIINQDDKAALVTELTDLRIRLQEAQKTLTKVETELKANRVTTFFDWLMIGLYISTLIFGGLSYIL